MGERREGERDIGSEEERRERERVEEFASALAKPFKLLTARHRREATAHRQTDRQKKI